MYVHLHHRVPLNRTSNPQQSQARDPKQMSEFAWLVWEGLLRFMVGKGAKANKDDGPPVQPGLCQFGCSSPAGIPNKTTKSHIMQIAQNGNLDECFDLSSRFLFFPPPFILPHWTGMVDLLESAELIRRGEACW